MAAPELAAYKVGLPAPNSEGDKASTSKSLAWVPFAAIVVGESDVTSALLEVAVTSVDILRGSDQLSDASKRYKLGSDISRAQCALLYPQAADG